jgi:hypothetical protein
MKPLLVGESNPYQTDPEEGRRFALYPDPPHSAGGRLCGEILGLTERDYLRMFDRTNLCGVKWNQREAAEEANRLVEARSAGDLILCCGARVAGAFGFVFLPFTIGQFDSLLASRVAGWPRAAILPHPSGRNRIWNDPGSIELFRLTLRRLGVPLL